MINGECVTGRKTYCITHHYNIGDQDVYIEAKRGFDVIGAAVYLQRKAEELSGDDCMTLSGLAIANAIVSLYGCENGMRRNNAVLVDMHQEREKRARKDIMASLKNNPEIARSDEEILTFLKPHFHYCLG